MKGGCGDGGEQAYCRKRKDGGRRCLQSGRGGAEDPRSRKGEVAERIIETAKENDVPFYQDNKLAETLSRLQIGDTIPPELYEVVAEILVFVDDMDRMKGKLKESGLL
mgnify:CR=1 FL=1